MKALLFLQIVIISLLALTSHLETFAFMLALAYLFMDGGLYVVNRKNRMLDKVSVRLVVYVLQIVILVGMVFLYRAISEM